MPPFPGAAGEVFNPIAKHYKSKAAMDESKKRLEDAEKAGLIHVETMTYGQYQLILASEWFSIGDRKKDWLREMGIARRELMEQDPTDLPGVTSKTMCGLLDNAVRKCFQEGLAIDFEARDKRFGEGNPEGHNLELKWEVNADGEKYLFARMKCPYKAPKKP